MPIFSYLAIPVAGAYDDLCADLKSMEYCEVIASDNKEVVVLVTDTPDEETDKKLQKRLRKLESLQSLSMTYGHSDEEETGK